MRVYLVHLVCLVELLHQPGLVKFDRPDRHVEKYRYILRALASGDQLQDFSLPWGEVGQRVVEFRLGQLKHRPENWPGNVRCEVDLAFAYRLNRLRQFRGAECFNR